MVAVEDEEVADADAAPRLLDLRVGEVLLWSKGVSSSDVDLRKFSFERCDASVLAALDFCISYNTGFLVYAFVCFHLSA